MGLSSSVLTVFLSGAAGGAAKLADTVLRSLVSQAVQDNEIGKVFGVVAVQGGKLLLLSVIVSTARPNV